MVKDKLSQIFDNISVICQKLGKSPQDIILVGVTKFASVEKIREAIEAGLKHIGENRVQEIKKKYPELKKQFPDIQCHMIGHLQSNKVKVTLEICDMIQSVDSVKIAQEIDKQARKLNRTADILIQINTSGEEQKFGTTQDESLKLIEEISRLQYIKIKGLMTIAPFSEDEQVIRPCFAALRQIREQAAQKFDGHTNIDLKYLSMGMSQDYDIALEEGANMLRIGSAIFADE